MDRNNETRGSAETAVNETGDSTEIPVETAVEAQKITIGKLLGDFRRLTLGSVVWIFTMLLAIVSASFGLGSAVSEKFVTAEPACAELTGIYREQNIPKYPAGPICGAPVTTTALIGCMKDRAVSIAQVTYVGIFETKRDVVDSQAGCGTVSTDRKICLFASEWHLQGVYNATKEYVSLKGSIVHPRIGLEECGNESGLDSERLDQLHSIKRDINARYNSADCKLFPVRKSGEISAFDMQCTYDGRDDEPKGGTYRKL